ncbi:MAG: proprotein convertase P-domain-containing protein [Candidatus Omnitrophica bacterium]|nr:proprotein convertase P-domain-containing protein [Candidatus Omnitrophota bacterium]
MSQIEALEIIGSDSDDTLTIDLGQGNPIPPQGLIFRGEGQENLVPGDILKIVNGTVETATYRFDNPNDGGIDLDGRKIEYRGLEPISSTISATNVTLDYGTNAETITVTDAGGGQTTVASTEGELTTFNNPSGTLTINAGGTGGDTVNVQSLDPSYTGAIVLNGQGGGDTFQIDIVPSGATMTVNGGAANDTINVGGPNGWDSILGALTVHGDTNDPTPASNNSISALGDAVSNDRPDGDHLHVLDEVSATTRTYTTNGSTLSRTGAGSINYDTLERVTIDTSATTGSDIDVTSTPSSCVMTLNAGMANDDIDVTAIGSNSVARINGGAGEDAFDVVTTSSDGLLFLRGESGEDTFKFLGTGSGLFNAIQVEGGSEDDVASVDQLNSTIFRFLGGSGADEIELGQTTSSDLAELHGGDGNDTFILGNGGANGLLGSFGVNGEGNDSGGIGDSLVLNDTFTTQTLNYTNANDGDIVVDGRTINYTGLEPITAGDSADTILNLPTALANNATLQDSADAGEIELISNSGTFEDTILPNPTNSLAVNLGNQSDVFTMNPLDAAYTVPLTIGGGAASGITLNYGAAAESLTLTDLGGGITNIDSTVSATVIVNNAADTLTLNAGETGDDTISIDSLPAPFPSSLVFNGQSGDDTLNINAAVNLAANKSFTATTDQIFFQTASSDLSTSGTGEVNLTADQNILLSVGSSITSSSGDITLEANLSGSATGNFSGISVDGGSIASVFGAIDLTGVGGDTGNFNSGVSVANSGTVLSTGTGPSPGSITIHGTAGPGVLANRGVVVFNSGASILSLDGDITIDGTGGANPSTGASDNDGVGIFASGTVTSLNSGNVTLRGTGLTGGGGDERDNEGVAISGSGTSVTTIFGSLILDGTGASGGTVRNEGVNIENGATVLSALSDISITGVGGQSGSHNDGVEIRSLGTRVSAGAGNLTIVGSAGTDGSAGSSSNRGVEISTQAVLSASAGSIDIAGSGVGENDNEGVFVAGTANEIYSTPGMVPIPDNGTANLQIAIDEAFYIADVDVTVDVTHTFDRDLTLTLISPFGTRVTLASRRGEGGDNFTSTRFDDDSGADLSAGAAPFTGTFRPESPLSAFDGESAQGTWTLEVSDNQGGDTGTIDFVEIEFNAPTAISTVSGPIHIDGTSNGSGNGNRGVAIESHARITSTSGEISIEGTGGGVDDNEGVLITDSNTSISTRTGKIFVYGKGTSTGDRNPGLKIDSGASVISTAGEVQLLGDGYGASEAAGVLIEGLDSKVDSGGLIQIGGFSFGATDENPGLKISEQATITALDGLNIGGKGSGSQSGGGANHGFVIDSATVSASTLDFRRLELSGTSGPDPNGSIGVLVTNKSNVISRSLDLLFTQQKNGTVFTPNIIPFEFETPAGLARTATLTVSATANLGTNTQFFTLDLEGLVTQNLFVDDGMSSTPVTTTVNLDAAQVAALTADGLISMTVTPSGDVSPLIGPTELEVSLSIPGAGLAPPIVMKSFESTGGNESNDDIRVDMGSSVEAIGNLIQVEVADDFILGATGSLRSASTIAVLGETQDGDFDPDGSTFEFSGYVSAPGLGVRGEQDNDTLILPNLDSGHLDLHGDLGGGGHTNPTFLASGILNASGNQNIAINFDGFSGEDRIQIGLGAPRSVGYFPDEFAPSINSGVVAISGETNLSFRARGSIVASGSGGTLTVDSSSLPGLTEMTLRDEIVNSAGPGGNAIEGDAFASLLFNGFTELFAFTGDGDESTTIQAVDTADNGGGVSLQNILVDGGISSGIDVGNDTFIVTPSTSANIEVRGSSPDFGDAGVPPGGDTLMIDLAGVGSAEVIPGTPRGDGQVQFGGSANPLVFKSIESFAGSGIFDAGDAPDPLASTAGQYPTLLANNGPTHDFSLVGPILGSAIDYEMDGLPESMARGDDNDGIDDEDGVAFPNPLFAETVANIEVTSATGGVLNYFFDFNRDGRFDGADESFTFVHPGGGAVEVPVPTPRTALLGPTFARFRISTAGVASAVGSATDGEVEDYQVTVQGIAPNLFIFPSDTVVSNDPGICGSSQTFTIGATGLPFADVVCEIEGFPIMFPHTFAVGTTTVSCTATNSAGVHTRSFTVTVNDTEIPSATCLSPIVALDELGSATITAASVDAGSTDNCGIASMVVSPTSFTCAEVGIQNVTLTVTDIHGNIALCTTTVMVIDNIPPTMIAPTLEAVTANATGEAILLDYTSGVVATDTCSSASSLVIAQSPSPGSTIGVGDNVITFSATDASGNVGEATATLTVNQADPMTDYDVKPEPPDGKIDARDLLEWYSRVEDGSPTEILFDFSRFWQRDNLKRQ